MVHLIGKANFTIEHDLRNRDLKQLCQQFVLLAVHTFEEFARVDDCESFLVVVIYCQGYDCGDHSRLAFTGGDADDATRLSLVTQSGYRTCKLAVIRDKIDVAKVVIDFFLPIHELLPLGVTEFNSHLLQLGIEFKLVLQVNFSEFLRILGINRFQFTVQICVCLLFGFGKSSCLGCRSLRLPLRDLEFFFKVHHGFDCPCTLTFLLLLLFLFSKLLFLVQKVLLPQQIHIFYDGSSLSFGDILIKLLLFRKI